MVCGGLWLKLYLLWFGAFQFSLICEWATSSLCLKFTVFTCLPEANAGGLKDIMEWAGIAHGMKFFHSIRFNILIMGKRIFRCLFRYQNFNSLMKEKMIRFSKVINDEVKLFEDIQVTQNFEQNNFGSWIKTFNFHSEWHIWRRDFLPETLTRLTRNINLTRNLYSGNESLSEYTLTGFLLMKKRGKRFIYPHCR